MTAQRRPRGKTGKRLQVNAHLGTTDAQILDALHARLGIASSTDVLRLALRRLYRAEFGVDFGASTGTEG